MRYDAKDYTINPNIKAYSILIKFPVMHDLEKNSQVLAKLIKTLAGYYLTRNFQTRDLADRVY